MSKQIIFDYQVSLDDITVENTNGNNKVLILRNDRLENASKNKYTYSKYTKGYFKATECLYNELVNEETAIVERDKISYPFLFLYRHTIEITIKEILFLEHDDSEGVHDLIINWNSLRVIVSTYLPKKNITIILDNLETYIIAINEFDKTSTQNRYPIQKKNVSSYKGDVCFSPDKLMKYMNDFMRQMDVIKSLLEKLKYKQYEEGENIERSR